MNKNDIRLLTCNNLYLQDSKYGNDKNENGEKKLFSLIDNRAKSTIACTTSVIQAMLIGVLGATRDTRKGNFSF